MSFASLDRSGSIAVHAIQGPTMYVITKRESNDLDTQIVQGYGDDQTDAAVVFTREDCAGKYLKQTSQSNEETVAELTGAANLVFLAKLSQEKIDQILVNPSHCDDENRLKNFGVLRVNSLIARIVDKLSEEIDHATELPISGGTTFVYHCQNCGSIEHRDEQQTLECCGHPMVLGATTQASLCDNPPK